MDYLVQVWGKICHLATLTCHRRLSRAHRHGQVCLISSHLDQIIHETGPGV